MGDPGAHSFVRRLDLRADREIAVELPREARFKGQAGPCYEAGPTTEERLEAASVVAGALAVERVVTVRIESIEDHDVSPGAAEGVEGTIAIPSISTSSSGRQTSERV
jgi:hypothetical protein